MSDTLLQKVLEVLISVAVPVITAAVVALVRQAVAQGKAQLSQTQLSLIDGVLRMFVRAAEQYDLSGAMRIAGKEKKDWVVMRAQNWLDGQGVKIDVGTLEHLVESAVLSELNMGKTLSAVSGQPPTKNIEGDDAIHQRSDALTGTSSLETPKRGG